MIVRMTAKADDLSVSSRLMQNPLTYPLTCWRIAAQALIDRRTNTPYCRRSWKDNTNATEENQNLSRYGRDQKTEIRAAHRQLNLPGSQVALCTAA